MINIVEYPTIKLSKLKPHPNNPRTHTPEQVEKIARSIKELGWGRPIIISTDYYILAGHGAAEAADILGCEEVPYRMMTHRHDSPEALAYMIADNKLTDESDWNYTDLELIFEDLKLEDFEVELTGFDQNQIQEVEEKLHGPQEITEDDFDPDEVVETTVQPGDIWELGNHRLMCGDSTKDYRTLIKNDLIDLLLTDPPYGINVVKQNKIEGAKPFGQGTVGGKGLIEPRQYKPIINDDKPFDPSFLLNFNCYTIIFGANNFASKLPDNSRWLVWDKKTTEEMDKDNFSDVELAWTNINKTSCKIYRYMWSGLIREGDRKTELHERVHPTQKPVGLIGKIIQDYSKENDVVLDLFGGSGSTLIACEQLNRRCYMMELDPHYCDVIITRWETFTGQKATKIS